MQNFQFICQTLCATKDEHETCYQNLFAIKQKFASMEEYANQLRVELEKEIKQAKEAERGCAWLDLILKKCSKS